MSQINKYSVQKVQADLGYQNLTARDEALIESCSLGNVPFLEGKYQLNGTFYTPDNILLEVAEDLKSYSITGINQGDAITELCVDPVQDALDSGYLGDVQVEYSVTDNLFSPSHDKDPEATLFIRELSIDRTEIRATSTTLTEEQLQGFAQDLYRKLNEATYFKKVNLHFLEENLDCWCLNVMTEVLDGTLIVTFKTYEPLPETLGIKSRFTVLEQIGEPVRFNIVRTVEVTEDGDSTPYLKGPNFDVENNTNVETGTVTDYLNYQELFSYPEAIRNTSLCSIYREQGIELGIDHSDFSNFIHFSSAAERLENFRYKLGLIQEYEQKIQESHLESEIRTLRNLVQGIVDGFDHYDRYLYFENTATAWPKEPGERPYTNIPVEDATTWFAQELRRAQDYDENNPDILVNTIPQTIRLDSRNEAYLVFVHMVGQQFDDEWLYAKAVATRYNGDNRLDFGIPKDLVQEALRSFGIELETGNQNLEELFNQCVPGQPYNPGTETSVQTFERLTAGSGSEATTEFQPEFVDNYRKEVYKRIYHNVPLLLKTKGTSRGLRALISCFGIPDDLLEITVAGGADIDQGGAFFGPEYYTSASRDRIRLDNQGTDAIQMFDEASGSFISGTVLSLDKQIRQPGQRYQAGTNNAFVGFRLNGQFDQQAKAYITSTSAGFDYDNLIGDPRNTGENYGETFTLLRNQIIKDLRGDSKELSIRTPTAILRLVRYYDSVLFRTLQSFVPARDVVSTGAIVDDSILHRNRYRGVDPEGQDLPELSASIETVYIDGGEAGSLKVLRGGRPAGKAPVTRSFVIRATSNRVITESRECPTVNYEQKNGVSVGPGYVTKTVFDDSPKFNGELLGTEHEVTNGELNEGNIFKHGGSSSKTVTYSLDYRFLCLPQYPVNTILRASGATHGVQFPLNTSLLTQTGNISINVENTQITGPLIVDNKISPNVICSAVVPRNLRGGWLCAIGKNPGKLRRYTNYFGLDKSTDFGSSNNSYRKAEVNRIGLTKSPAILLPAEGNSQEMVAYLNLKALDSQEGDADLWGRISEPNREIYPRTLNPGSSSRRGLSITLLNPEEWDPISRGGLVQPLGFASNLVKLTETATQKIINPEKLTGGSLRKIFVQARGGYAVIDFVTSKIRQFDLYTEYRDWVTLKGYDNLWTVSPELEVKDYLGRRYSSKGLCVTGVSVEDSRTGIIYTGSRRITLLESYMGCPYVFGSSTLAGDYQLLIEDWE